MAVVVVVLLVVWTPAEEGMTAAAAAAATHLPLVRCDLSSEDEAVIWSTGGGGSSLTLDRALDEWRTGKV